jgi:hypothetical protein
MNISTIIQQNALIGLAKWITSPEAWDNVNQAVAAINENPNLSGDEKRAIIFTNLKEAGWKWANWALNLVIEIAVSIIKMQAQQQSLNGEH